MKVTYIIRLRGAPSILLTVYDYQRQHQVYETPNAECVAGGCDASIKRVRDVPDGFIERTCRIENVRASKIVLR